MCFANCSTENAIRTNNNFYRNFIEKYFLYSTEKEYNNKIICTSFERGKDVYVVDFTIHDEEDGVDYDYFTEITAKSILDFIQPHLSELSFFLFVEFGDEAGSYNLNCGWTVDIGKQSNYILYVFTDTESNIVTVRMYNNGRTDISF